MFHELSKIEKRLGDLWDLRLQSHFQMFHQLILKFLVKFWPTRNKGNIEQVSERRKIRGQ